MTFSAFAKNNCAIHNTDEDSATYFAHRWSWAFGSANILVKDSAGTIVATRYFANGLEITS